MIRDGSRRTVKLLNADGERFVIGLGTILQNAKSDLFTEIDFTAGTAKLILVQPDGSGRQVLLTQPATANIGTPRWLY